MAYTSISSHQGGNLWPSDWGTSGTLGIICSRDFLADDGKSFQQANGTSLTNEFVTTATITVAANIPTYGSFSLPKTDVASPITVRYTGVIFDANGVPRDFLFSNFDLVTSLGNSISFLAWWNDNQQTRIYPIDTVPTTTQMNIAIAAAINAPATTTQNGIGKVSVNPVDSAHPIFVGNNDPRMRANASSYASLNAAVAAIGSTPTTLAISTAAYPSGDSCTVPATLQLQFVDAGTLSVANGKTIVILSDQTLWPSRAIFLNALAGQGTISFNGNTSLSVLSANWWGAVPDDTTSAGAAIQATITAAVNLGMSSALSSTVVVEMQPGVYLIDNALNQTSIYNAQITIPVVGTSEAGPRPQLIIRSSNQGSSPQPYGQVKGGANVLLHSTLTGQGYSGTYGLPCIMAGPDAIHGTTYSLHTYMGVHLQGVGFKAPSNPTICGFNGQMLDSLIVEDSLFTTTDLNVGYGTAVQPTHPTGIAILMPLNNFNGSEYRGMNVATGWYAGFGISELTTVSGNLYSVQNYVGFNVVTPWYHTADIGMSFSVRNPYGIAQVDPSSGIVNLAGLGPNNVTIFRGMISFEDATSGWMQPVYHINDPGSKLIGCLDYIHVVSGTGADGAGLTKNGATLVTTRNLQNPWLTSWGTDNAQVRGGTGNNSTAAAAYSTIESRSDAALGEFNAYSTNFATPTVRQKVAVLAQGTALGMIVGTNVAGPLDFMTNGINFRGGYATDGAFKFYGISAPAVSGSGNAHLYATTGGKLQLSQNGGAYTQVAAMVHGTVAINPASINGTTVSSQTFTLTGALTTDSLVMNPPTAGLTAGLLVTQCYVSAADTITIVFYNTTGAPIDEGSASWSYSLIR